MHSRIRIVGGICFGVVAVMCTAIPLLLAQDRSRPFSAATLVAIARVEAEIDRIEADALGRVRSVPDNQVQQIELLGKLMLFDKELSVNRNEACAFCHTPETGFTGPVSELNRTTGSYPGSVRTRFSECKPQTHTYAPLAPVLHYNEGQDDLVGGNFWDMRLAYIADHLSDSAVMAGKMLGGQQYLDWQLNGNSLVLQRASGRRGFNFGQ
jgi:cytochrome c peroxidase